LLRRIFLKPRSTSLINKEKDSREKDEELVELRGSKVSSEEEFGKFIDKTLNIARDV
jgi:hypothetical protein